MQQAAFTACARLGAGVFSSGAAFSRAFHRSPALFSLFVSLTAGKEFCDLYMHSARQRGSIILALGFIQCALMGWEGLADCF